MTMAQRQEENNPRKNPRAELMNYPSGLWMNSIWWAQFFSIEIISYHFTFRGMLRYLNATNVGIAIIIHPFLMAYTTHLCWLGGWFIIAIPMINPWRASVLLLKPTFRHRWNSVPEDLKRPAGPMRASTSTFGGPIGMWWFPIGLFPKSPIFIGFLWWSIHVAGPLYGTLKTWAVMCV